MPETVVVPGDREHAVRCWHFEERRGGRAC